ncbi:putative F-box protein [Cardamine amara subsp. amara]|uniref:F-box protein n=1 Tax=Cardamine amara subsp. amara TaxID=228776 RepID=A0ABD1BVA8_CARAN
MNRVENSDSIPTDLFLEIFSRLPAKSIGRFRCVSNQWRSMLHSPDFTDLFFTKSSARPRLLFGVEQDGECFFFSSPQPKSSSLDFHTKFVSEYSVSYCCGLIYLRNMWIQKENKEAERVICNPITGQYTILPELKANLDGYSYLGFDPIDKQFKLLVMNTRGYIANSESVHQILTLGSGNMKWRNVQCPFTHEPFHERIYINGVLYYLAQCFDVDGTSFYVIVCFDVRSEEFKFIDIRGFCYGATKLVNYKGKLGAINYYSGMRNLKLHMWVLENVEKQEWLKFVYTFPDSEVVDSCDLCVAGVTATGEIVLSMKFTSKRFYVFYFNPERNTLQPVQIHGNNQVLEKKSRVFAFVDHVEDLKFDIMCAATSISPPEQTSTSTSIDHQNEKAITEEVANGSLYKEADKVISGRLFRGSGCLKGTAITAVVVAATGAVAAVFLSSNPEATTELINLVDSYANVIITTLKN